MRTDCKALWEAKRAILQEIERQDSSGGLRPKSKPLATAVDLAPQYVQEVSISRERTSVKGEGQKGGKGKRASRVALTIRSWLAQLTPPISPRGKGSSDSQSPPNAAEAEEHIARGGWSSSRTRDTGAYYGCLNCGSPEHWTLECHEPPSQGILGRQKECRPVKGNEKLPTPDLAVSTGTKARAGQ